MPVEFIIAIAAVVIITIIGFALHKHYTSVFGMTIEFVIFAIILTLLFEKSLTYALVAVITLICYAVSIYFHWNINHKKDEEGKLIPYLDFSKVIASFSRLFAPLMKSNDGRIIGKVLPYNKYQLKYNGRYLCQSEVSAAGATLISGSIGSGKTFGMKSLIKQNISKGQNVIFAEYKGDGDLVKELSDFAKSYNYKVYRIEQGESDFNYDPLLNLNNVGRIEAIMNMRKWSIDGSDAHYKTGTQLLLQKLVGEFGHMYQNIDDSGFFSYTVAFYNYVKTYHPDRDEWDSYATVAKLLELLLTSSFHPMFNGFYTKTLNFQKLKESNQKFIIIVSFVSSNKELATSFSSLMFKDLLDEATVRNPRQNIYLYIDEFGTLENPFIIKDILEKGRSGKLATTLALQDINQIVIQTNEAYLNSILGIINTFIVYSGATRVTAEKFAGVQLADIETVLMNLRKPINGHKPTAIYISKYPTLNKNITSEVFRFVPYIFKGKGEAQGGEVNNNYPAQEEKVNNDDQNVWSNSISPSNSTQGIKLNGRSIKEIEDPVIKDDEKNNNFEDRNGDGVIDYKDFI